ncbi:hypothetical protein B0H11DRAFT_2182902 [Mycena galericulata]|nr:hypothetical protein B0H11DRAFT_2182902 [Mycena galericulata]
MSSPRPSQASSLLELPTELLLEIASLFPFPFDVLSPPPRQIAMKQQERLERRQIFATLSQTCSALRTVFLPLLWRHVETSKSRLHLRPINSSLRKDIFPHIRSFHGAQYHSAYELSNLFLLLRALPNLDCIEIHSINSYVLNTLANDHAFSEVKFTTVTTLSIPTFTHRIFSAFPNVQTLASPSMYFSSEALVTAKNAFPRLHSLFGVQLVDHVVIVTIAAPVTSHSKVMRLHNRFELLSYPGYTQALLSRLANMKNLCELALVESNVSEAIPLADNIAVGTNVLQKSKGRGQKVLKVWERDAAGDYRPHPTVILVRDE